MKTMILLIWTILIFSPLMAFGQEIYQWVDEKGTLHFADDLSSVPEKYLDQVKTRKPPKEESRPAPPPIAPQPKKTEESAPERKDLLGRGEEFWRARAKEWSGKYQRAKKNYEEVTAAYQAKEKELEQSIYKPDSLKRKLKGELKALEEKSDDWKGQMDEAKNMLERVLPKEAEDYKANPEWLRIEE
jgi:hypothetical protein